MYRRTLVVLATLLATGCRMPEKRYVELLTRAHNAMSVRQRRLEREFRLSQWKHWEYDEAAGILVFADGDTAWLLADIQFVGEVSRRDSTWTWGWKLPYVSGEHADAARRTRTYGWVHGIPKLRESGWHADRVDGWEMTSMAGWITGAEGGYSAPSSDSTAYTFLLLRNVRWAPAGRTVDSYMIRARSRPRPDR
ncbi:MAG TPA: hypothetical protein VFH27_14810 [Longimicrobiaceae bacterium]|nr:hypothetical protein [Longimicrobiaceae bacterium]